MKGTALASRQICGAVVIVIMAVLAYAARDLIRYAGSPERSPVAYEREGSGVTVELAGDRDHGGIYFLPRGAAIRDLFSEAGIHDISGFEETVLAGVLNSGDRITCDTARYRVIIDDMSASARLALGMPIDLNRATVEDLVLVPGIGRKTASKIVWFREEKGDFPEVDALKRVKGLGKKQYDRIKGYLSVKRASCS